MNKNSKNVTANTDAKDLARVIAQEEVDDVKVKGLNLNFEIFNNENLGSVRTAHDLETNEIWFCAQDVCKCLELNNVSQAASDLLDSEKTNIILNDNGSNYKHRQLFVTESGLYMLIMRSRKPVAKPFQRWVTCVVLPSIRKHGSYVMGQENLPAEDRVLLLETVKRLSEKVKKTKAVADFNSEDSNYWFDMYCKLLNEQEDIKNEIRKSVPVEELPNGGIRMKETCVTNQMLVVEITDGKKYETFDREMR